MVARQLSLRHSSLQSRQHRQALCPQIPGVQAAPAASSACAALGWAESPICWHCRPVSPQKSRHGSQPYSHCCVDALTQLGSVLRLLMHGPGSLLISGLSAWKRERRSWSDLMQSCSGLGWMALVHAPVCMYQLTAVFLCCAASWLLCWCCSNLLWGRLHMEGQEFLKRVLVAFNFPKRFFALNSQPK